jgi:signal transduction histidine kinase
MDEKKKIAVVDDIQAYLTMAKKVLSGRYQVFPIPSAAKLFELLSKVRPDLILLDIVMPEMTGYEAARKLKSCDEFKEIPIIFLTGVQDKYNEIEGFSLGAVDYIHKPYEKDLLLKRIETHLAIADYQSALIKEKSLAQKAAQSGRTFLSTMSHEIRTPLSAVIGMLQIAKNTDDPVKIKDCVTKAENASQLLLGLVNSILDMSKIEANKLELASHDFYIKNMLLKIANVVNVSVEAKNQNFIIRVNDKVPQYVQGDELRLSQVLVNLLTNAVKFTPEYGTITLSISALGSTDKEVTLFIEIADTGVGITKEQQNLLFAHFALADAHISRKHDVAGLGLTISKRIVELMGGDIYVESETGKGSKFTCIVTVNKASQSGASAPPPMHMPDPAASSSRRFSDTTLLVVEDIEINREIVQAFLAPTFINIEFAVNGKEAVRMFKEAYERYDMIFMDVQMPEMDGYQSTQRIRELDIPKAKTIPIVAMTANAFKEDMEKCLACGMNDHVAKPLNAEELLHMLNKYL